MKRILKSLIKLFFFRVFFIFFVSFSFRRRYVKRPLSFNMSPKEGLSSEWLFAIAVQGEELWFGTESGGAHPFMIRPRRV